ncbi:hypothetical protein [Spirillospora albida]|uniref:hypothetical protein n=1 Tax=Spirillospora albida TaxID=58123 RepID=UPI000B303AA9|nr:hypothetical protein [Spirillospora albida]
MDDAPPGRRGGATAAVLTRPGVMLAMATLGFAVNFWAWALLSPLGPRFRDALDLTSFQQGATSRSRPC